LPTSRSKVSNIDNGRRGLFDAIADEIKRAQ
jgi:hypothetical protein